MSGNDPWFDAGVNALQQDTATQVRSSVSQALAVNPDTEAELRRNAAAAQVPLPAARAYPDETKVQAQMSQFDADMLARKFPSTAQLISNPDVAKIAHDDIPRTTQVEQATTALVKAPPGPTDPALWDQVRTPDFWVGMAKYLFSANEGKDNFTSDLGSVGRSFSSKLGKNAALVAGAPAMAVDAATSAITGNTHTEAQDAAFSVAARYDAGVNAENANAKADQFHNKLVKSAATLGLQLPAMLATSGGQPAVSLATTGTETLAQYLGQTVVHGAKAMAVPAVNDAIDTMHRVYEKTGDLAAAARAGQAQYAVSTAGGVIPINAPGGLLTRLASGAVVGGAQSEVSRQAMNVAMPSSMQTPFSGEELALGATTGSMLGGVMGPQAPGDRAAAVRAFNDAYDTAHAELQNKQLLDLAKASASSKLRERDPETFKQFVKDIAEQGDTPRGIFIDSGELQRVLAAHDITADELQQTMPQVAEQLRQAATDMAPKNGLVQIPVEDFATHIAGSDLEQPLLEHMRVTPEGGTLAEAQNYRKAQADELKTQAERLTQTNADDVAYQQSLKSVGLDITNRLQHELGMHPDIAAANAAPLVAFYQVQGDRHGILPHQMAERAPIRFANREISGNETLKQGDILDLGDLHHLENNASGESSASLEAQNRLASEQAAGQHRYVLDARTGQARPLTGVDAVDTHAGAGQIVVQRGVGEKTWTVLSSGGDVSRNQVIAAVARGESTGALHQSLSTRVPTTTKNPENALGEMPLFADLATMKTEPEKLAQNVALLEGYAGLKLKGTVDQKLEQFIEHVKNNLLFLHDSVDPDTRLRSKLWYDGARHIVDEWAPHYGITDAQVSGMLAVLSPQKDWFMNVSLAKRVADTMHEHQGTTWDEGMTKTAARIYAKPEFKPYLDAITGKKLGELKDPFEKALWIRAYDETHNDRGHEIVSPEGKFTGPRLNNDGKTPTKTGWGSTREIAKAVSIMEDGSPANISEKLGGEHKVRNFYNNIFDPNSEHGYATIDTHAVAAGLLRPLSGSSPEVLHNFGSNEKGQTGPASSRQTGLSGTYAIYHEAYKRAAAERGLLPREMQSITWEAVRGLFKDTFKSQKGNHDAINEIWSGYKAGKLTLDAARAAIVERAGGISNPEWLGSAAGEHEGARGAADARGVPEPGVPGRGAEPAAGGVRGEHPSGAEGLDRFAGESPAFHQSFGTPEAVSSGQHPLVNIGLDIPGGGHLSANEAMQALRDAGIEVRGNAVHQSDTEQTLVAELSRPLTPEEGHAISVKLRQEAIVQKTGETGALYGPEASKWGDFNPDYFLLLNGERASAALQQESRGTFNPTTKTITALKSADLSTFQHELGHFFLDTLAHLAAQPDAPVALKRDMQTVLNWGGVPDLDTWHRMSLDEQRALHEKFATGWESYLMKGEAPTLEMRSLFARFRSWMLHVYKALKGAPGDYTPEVKGVFDRMIASEDAIAQAEHARRYMALFDEPGQAGMTSEQWAEYQALGKDATERAVEALTGQTLRDMARIDKLRAAALKTVTADAKAKRTAIENEVKGEVLAEPVYHAWSFLTARKDKTEGADAKNADATTGAGKLNFGSVEKVFGTDVANKLYELKMTAKKSGFEPDALADIMGFPDGQTLVKSLVSAEPPSSVIEGMTDQRMLERHGEISDPQSMQRTADELVHNEARAQFVATELKALKKATGSAKEIAKAAKEAAANAIDTRRIRDIQVGAYDAAETRSAKAAEKAMSKGDTAGAAAAKRDQILNMELARSAREAQTFVAKALDYLAKFDKPSVRENIDLEYRDQIDALLARADLRKSTTATELNRREALLSFVERLAADGYKPDIPEALLDEAQRWHYKDMPLSAFKGLVDSVKSIEQLGRLKQTLRDGQETRAVNDLANEMADTAAKLPQRAAESNRGLTRMGQTWMKTKAFGRSAQAAVLKMEQMFDWLDARNTNGVLNRVVFRRISDAQTHENELLARVKAQIDEIVHSNLDEITKDKRIYTSDGLIDGATGLPQKFTVKEMLMLAGNYGNESNLQKMARGERWDPEQVKAFLDANMTKAHWDFVAGMGRTLESLWPLKLEMDRRLGNTSPEKIEPRAFSTPHGDYAGWYWPMMYDPARSQDVAERGARAGDAMFENIYSRANTDTGRMNTRNENYARPLLLDLDALPRMIKEEIHDVSFREAIIDADRFLAHPTVRKAIVGALSQEHYDQIRPWLQSIAQDGKLSTDGARGMEFMNAVAREARMRATMVGLGLRLSTAVVHGLTAASESVSELGAKWMASGMRDFADPRQWAANKDFIFERSGEMRNRMNEVDRDVREHLRQIDLKMMDPTTGAVQRGADVMRAHAYSFIAGLDMASALPTWMGAYKKGLETRERGGLEMSEQDAIYFADKTVRNAHGGTGIKDMARIQRGTEFQKLFTMFYTFWNHNVNRIIDTSKLITSPEHRAMLKERNNWTNTQLATTIILRTLAYTIGTQAIHSLINPPPKKEDNTEGWLKWAAKEFTAAAFAGIPIARDISAHFLTGRDYSATPAASVVDAMGRQGTDVQHALTGEKVSDKWVKHAITTSGYVFNLPTGQVGNTAQFIWDLSNGNVHPTTSAEWWAGIAHGDIHAHH